MDLLRTVCVGPATSAPRQDLANKSEGEQRSSVFPRYFEKSFAIKKKNIETALVRCKRFCVSIHPVRRTCGVYVCRRIRDKRNKLNKFPVEIEHYLHGRYSLLDSCKSETIVFVPGGFNHPTQPVRTHVLRDRIYDPWIQIQSITFWSTVR